VSSAGVRLQERTMKESGRAAVNTNVFVHLYIWKCTEERVRAPGL